MKNYQSKSCYGIYDLRHLYSAVRPQSLNSQSKKKKKLNTKKPINSNTNYHREMKCLPINMHHCLYTFEGLKFF